MAFFDFVMRGFWPVIFIRFFSNSSKSLIDFLVAKDHIPTATTTFSSFGTALTFFMLNFFANAGRISFLNCASVAILK